MKLIKRATLALYWAVHPKAESPLARWADVVKSADWSAPPDVKRSFGSADFIGNDRWIFDIGGNNYRIVAVVLFRPKLVLLRFVGSHADYDRIDPQTV